MSRGSTERKRESKSRKNREKEIEQRRILNCEVPREPVLIPIIVGKGGLHACQTKTTGSKRLHCFAQLCRPRNIFSVIDNQELSTGKSECVIAGFWFREWMRWWNKNQFNISRKLQIVCCVDRSLIGFFQHKFDVELGKRVIQLLNGIHQYGKNVCFLKQGNHNCVEREVPVTDTVNICRFPGDQLSADIRREKP